MATNYTNTQIIDAAEYAASQTSSHYRNVSLDYLENFLDALPDQQDDWQDVTDIRQIRRGDMLKNQTENAVITHRHAVKSVDLSNGIIHLDADEVVLWHDNHAYYRIPAPVVAPNPAEHPVILIHRSSGIKHVPPAVAITRKNNMTDDIHYVFKDYGVQSPADITEWEPAKVVADDE